MNSDDASAEFRAALIHALVAPIAKSVEEPLPSLKPEDDRAAKALLESYRDHLLRKAEFYTSLCKATGLRFSLENLARIDDVLLHGRLLSTAHSYRAGLDARKADNSKAETGATVLSDIEQHAKGLRNAVAKLLASPEVVLLIHVLGSKSDAAAVLNRRGRLMTDLLVRLGQLQTELETLQAGATKMLAAPRVKAAVSKAELYRGLAAVLHDAAGWSPGQYDAKVIRKFAEIFYPWLHANHPLKPKSERALRDGLISAVKSL